MTTSATATLAGDLITAIGNGDAGTARHLIERGADPRARDPHTGLTVLMTAAGRGDRACVHLLLEAGADVFATDSRAGATALHKACQGGDVEVVRMLVNAGAFVDAVTASTGHTPLMDALWFKDPDITRYLLDHDAGVNLATHYGFSLQQHLDFEMRANATGHDRLERAARYVDGRRERDQDRVTQHRLMAAVTAGDAAEVRRLLDGGVPVDLRFPVVNGFNDAHTALLVAARDGHTAIAEMLLRAGADVNAVEPTFGAVPLHKAVYNGHADLTRLIAGWSGVDLDFQGSTNGYTPLHDAIWHGYEECARILVDAGADLSPRGHDGTTPPVLAARILGPDHPLTRHLRDREARP